MQFISIYGTDSGGVTLATDQAIASTGIDSPDKVDASPDKGAGVLKSASTLSMFTPTRVVVVSAPEKVSVAVARKLAGLTHPGAIIFTGEKPVSAAVRKALPDLQVQQLTLPKPGGAARQWVTARFSEAGVQAPQETLPNLAELATTPLGASRIRHLVSTLQAAGNLQPSAETVGLLTSDLAIPEAVWAASDAVTRGDISSARAGEEVEPIVALSMLARRIARIGAAVEDTCSPRELASLLGMRDNAIHMMTRSVKISAADIMRAYNIVIDASARCRQHSDPNVARAIADSASMRAAAIFAGTA